MIDINKEDERLINDAMSKFMKPKEDGTWSTLWLDILKEVISKKNKVFNDLCTERLDRRIEELAQEKAKDINGVPVRTMLARDFAVALINKMERFTNEEVTGIAVELADTLLKRLKR